MFFGVKLIEVDFLYSDVVYVLCYCCIKEFEDFVLICL